MISCQQKKFPLCGLGVVMPYYYTGLEYKGGIYEIEKEILSSYNIVKTQNNGIAKISFKVNCKGELGDLNYEAYDLSYNQTTLNDTIRSQLIAAISKLSDWSIGTDSEGNTVNSHSFLSFRIKEGEITQILPK